MIYLDASIFSKESIFKCVYWYGDSFRTEITKCNENNYRVALTPSGEHTFSEEDLHAMMIKVERDFVDFNLRDIVAQETNNIRDLLIAKAFSNGEFDEEPPGEITDPVGFVINKDQE